ADPIELGRGADDQAAPGDRRRCQGHLVQRVPAERLEFGARLDHIRVAVLAQREHLAVVCPWGRRKRGGVGAQSLSWIDWLPPRLIAGREEAAIVENVVAAAIHQWRGMKRPERAV